MRALGGIVPNDFGIWSLESGYDTTCLDDGSIWAVLR